MWSENRKLNSKLGEDLQSSHVHSGFGKPHAFRLAPESELEIGNTPSNLSEFVAFGPERHDSVVVALSDCIPVPGVVGHTAYIRLEDLVVDVVSVPLEPRHQCRPEVEAHLFIVADKLDDLPLSVEDSSDRIRRVALGGDSLIPIVIWSSRVLYLDVFEPGVFARRLVEVAVDADKAIIHILNNSKVFRLAGIPPTQRLCESRANPTNAVGGWSLDISRAILEQRN